MSSVLDEYIATHAYVFEAKTTEERIAVTIDDPLAFALLYLPHHLKDENGTITLAQVHLDWVEQAKRWINPGPRRDSNVAPRNTGKSTWFFLIFPLWAASHGHIKFAAAFAHSGSQAEEHLKTFKGELDNNKLLRYDFPFMVSPARRERGQSVSDNRNMIVQKNGFAFAARGVDAANLGLKVGNTRPDLIIFDDIEPDEAQYSAYQAGKRRNTIIEAILPMNFKATVVFVGTVTMAGGITHQLVKSKMTKEPVEQWILDEDIVVHYFAPIIEDADGNRASIWPEKWPLAYLLRHEHERTFAKNFKNLPVNSDGEYWTEEDFEYGDIRGVTKTIISVDGAVTTKKTSDFTGLAVIGYRPRQRTGRPGYLSETGPKCVVYEVVEVKLQGEALRKKVLSMITQSLRPVTMILVEVNQGGEMWNSVFHDMPVPVKVIVNSINKEVRAARLLTWYQRGYVAHIKKLHAVETQMMAYPDVLHDDMLDAVATGVTYFANRRKPKSPASRVVSHSYL